MKCVSPVRMTHNPCHSEGAQRPKNPERSDRRIRSAATEESGAQRPKNPERSDRRGDRPVAPTSNNHVSNNRPPSPVSISPTIAEILRSPLTNKKNARKDEGDILTSAQSMTPAGLEPATN